MVLAYILTFSSIAIARHASFNSNAFDLGLFDQTVWNTLHGRIFYYTTTGQPLLHLSNHADYILLLVAPFYLIYSGPETLLVLQATAIALGGLPLFWWTSQKLESHIAGLSLLAAYLLFPGLALVTLRDFHPPGLAVGFLMFAFYFLIKETRLKGETPTPSLTLPSPFKGEGLGVRVNATNPNQPTSTELGGTEGRLIYATKDVWLFLLFATLAMMTKEQIPLLVAFMGLYAIVRQRRWKLGLFTLAYSLSFFFITINWVIPRYSVTGESLFLDYYGYLGESPSAIIITTLTRPDLVLESVWEAQKLRYLFDLLAPFAFLPVLGLPALLVGMPSFAINLLSTNTAMHSTSVSHYVADVAPWVAWGTAFGAVYLRRSLIHFWPRYQTYYSGSIALVVLVASLSFHHLYGHSPLARTPEVWVVDGHDRLAQKFIEQIPVDAPISAQGTLYPHVSQHVTAYQFPDVHEAEYIFLDVTSTTWPMHPNDYKREIDRLLNEENFGILMAGDGYILLKKGATAKELPPEFYTFAYVEGCSEIKNPESADTLSAWTLVSGTNRQDACAPSYSRLLEFENGTQFLGFDVLDDPRKQETRLRLYWRSQNKLLNGFRLYPFILDTAGQIIEDTNQRPMTTQIWLSPEDWTEGEIVVSETLPWPLGKQWSLGIGLLRGDDWADWSQRIPIRAEDNSEQSRLFEARTWARVGTFARSRYTLEPVPPAQVELTGMNPIEVNFDDKITLLGYELEAINPETEILPLTLYWQALANLSRDYTIFVHVVNDKDEVVAQLDAQPWWQVSLPTSTWLENEQIKHLHPIPWPENLSKNETYKLRIGLYTWPDLMRLPILEREIIRGDYVEFETIIIPK